MTRLALLILLTAACYGDTQVQHFAFGLAPGEYHIVTSEADTIQAGRPGPAGDFAWAQGRVFPMRIERVEG